MVLSEIELDLIKKYEDRFRQSRSNYLRNVVHIDMLKLVEIYNKITNTNYKLNGNCSSCQLNFFKAFDKAYTKYKEEVQKELEPITDNQEVIGNTDTSNDKKKKKTKKL